MKDSIIGFVIISVLGVLLGVLLGYGLLYTGV